MSYKLPKRTLGKTGLKVSLLGLGGFLGAGFARNPRDQQSAVRKKASVDE